MKLLINLTVIFLTSLLFNAVFATDNGELDLLCKNGKIVRNISVKVNSEKNGCITTYTKAGIEKKIGWGQNTKSCLDVAEKLEETLSKNSWKCRDISSVMITESDN